MKKTLFNASLEESMNLVTDKYIEVSKNTAKTKKIFRKLMGLLTLLCFILLVNFGIMSIETTYNLPMYNSLFSILIAIVSIGISIVYIIKLCTKVYQENILTYYYFNKYMLPIVFLFIIECYLLFIDFSVYVTGNKIFILLYYLLLLVLMLNSYRKFRQEILDIFGKGTHQENKILQWLDYFVLFSRKYGGVVIIILAIVRLLFPIHRSNTTGLSNIQVIFGMFSPLLVILFYYLTISLWKNNFQGYYLQKYLEDYRQLSGCSVEEWYGKKSKMYKESLKNNN